MLVGWGDKDPWEPIDLGRAYAQFDCVEDFIVLPNVGHCPQVPFYLWCIELFLEDDIFGWHLSDFPLFAKLTAFLQS